ncbi:MAG: NADH-quinone oxidoreductase subunit J [Chloroflexota bacterium]
MSLQVLLFIIISALAVASALVTISTRHPVKSAMSLIFHFFMLAGLYLTLNAQFLAVVQVLVYAGAIMVLVIFVIMLLNLGAEGEGVPRIEARAGKQALAGILAAGVVTAFMTLFFSSPNGADNLSAASAEIGTAASIGRELYTNHIAAFEAVGILLTSAIIGAVVLAKKHLKY